MNDLQKLVIKWRREASLQRFGLGTSLQADTFESAAADVERILNNHGFAIPVTAGARGMGYTCSPMVRFVFGSAHIR